MAKPKTIMIDDQEYVRTQGVQQAPKNSNIKIVILQRGWVMIGRWSEDEDNCSLDDAYVIRRWGTDSGLGQLALEGKQSETKLEKTGHVDFHRLTVVSTINCKDELWDNEL